MAVVEDIYAAAETLEFPCSNEPGRGTVVEIVPGILWTRLELPFLPGHVNVYFVRDADGWAIIDTGIDRKEHREAFRRLVEGPLGGRVTRIIVTHHHPDHMGLAGWLCSQYAVPLYTSRSSFIWSQACRTRPDLIGRDWAVAYYVRHGVPESLAVGGGERTQRYVDCVAPLPPTYTRLVPGTDIRIGERNFRILTGEGHAPEQVLLYCESEGLLFSADQVIERISPNISAWVEEPGSDFLGHYLGSLQALSEQVEDDALVMAGHRRPFVGFGKRCRSLALEHRHRCDQLLDACRERPRRLAELVPVIFRRELTPLQFGLAFDETRAHVNRLVIEGALLWDESRPERPVLTAA